MRGGRLQPRLMAKPAIVTLILFGLLAPATAADDAVVQQASVSPKQGFTDSKDGVKISYRITGSAPADVTITISGSGHEVRAINVPGVVPGGDQDTTWDGLANGGDPVDDGTYKIAVGIAGGAERDAGSVELHGHFFPVRGPHGTRGGVGEFHASRNGGRRHQGFDVTGRCGTPLAAVRTGTVTKRAFDPRLDGNFVVIRGLGENRSYLYAHLVRPSSFQKGDEVHIGEIVGHIGRTGNANSPGIPCHLHFEIHIGGAKGRAIDPKPDLQAWDRFS
jgi:murein DD-endopeptidase MepM/ murein hydrolase activator NlpD